MKNTKLTLVAEKPFKFKKDYIDALIEKLNEEKNENN